MTRTECFDVSRDTVDDSPTGVSPRPRPSTAASLRRLEEYILRDEQSLARQRLILADCDGPARAIAQATVAEYEQSLAALYRRRARLLARA